MTLNNFLLFKKMALCVFFKKISLCCYMDTNPLLLNLHALWDILIKIYFTTPCHHSAYYEENLHKGPLQGSCEHFLGMCTPQLNSLMAIVTN